MYNHNTEQTRKPMSFEELCPIFNKFQKIKASTQIRKVDRTKTTLTYHEQLNKFAQMGGIVYNDKALFTFDQFYGMGILITTKQKILGATISDFFAVSRG